MITAKTRGLAVAAMAGIVLAGCTSIQEVRGYLVDPMLYTSIKEGLDNQRSVEGTLGRPTFTSQYGQPTWYYVSSTTGRRPFQRPSVQAHQVLAVTFDDRGEVVKVERSGLERVAYLDPDGDVTPTLGVERGFFEDLFGNIGTVGQGAGPAGGAPGQ